MKPGSPLREPFASINFFRAAWMYRRLPPGDAMLEAGRGMSPAFFALLRLIEREQPVSFGALGQSLAWLHADDLELWLAELCRMGLITPAIEAGQAEVRIAEAVVPFVSVSAPVPAPVSVPVPAFVPAFVPASEPASFGVDWKRSSLDALYVELLAICSELQLREGEAPTAMAA